MITNDADSMSPFIFPHGFKHNTESYIKSLREVVLPWIKEIATGRTYLSNINLYHSIQPEERFHGSQTISVIISALEFRYVTHQSTALDY